MMEQNFKSILEEELKASFAKLKEEGKQVSREVLEIVVLEVSDMVLRISKRTENKVDDFYAMIKGMIDEELKKIDGK